ncbi:hypothetical protein KBB27_03620 [Patescibacteria group bacterium]|nr:hypothetical protein [Patescibacteria group bacterium]
MGKTIEIVFVTAKAAADVLVEQGFEAIECSFGNEGSSMGPLAMDHHGPESWREGVALRAYRDHFGARRDDPRFVVTGAADADACFAIASLCGLLPHPSRAAEFEKAPPPVKAAGTKDMGALAALVNQVDTAPIGVRLEETAEGVTLLLWNQMSSSAQDSTAFHAGVDRWRALLGRAPKALLAAAKTEEANRVAEARKAEVTKVSDEVAMVESQAWGFDVWYAEQAPVIVAYVAANGNITIGCTDTAAAEAKFGPGGLKNVFDLLEPKGWGGREAIGGSPRGMKLTREQALEAAKVIDAAIKR